MPTRPHFFLEGLLNLARYDKADRRGVFRQSIASIALATPGESPLERCDADALANSVRVALGDGLFDDLDWLAASAAGVALYEIAGALPHGDLRRELGRRVGLQLYEGNASTFVAIATRMAGGSVKGLSSQGIHARVALTLGLPGSAYVPADPLALALVSRRELAADWIGARSIGALPDRRLAARLIERAAREAESRARQGDDAALRLFQKVRRGGDSEPPSSRRRGEPDSLEGAWQILLADRETLVWRHVAAARGLLAKVLPDLGAQIRGALTGSLSPTEWRRGATSLVASIAVDPDGSLGAAMDLLQSPLLDRDPGIATAMIWGLPRAADAEPEAAAELLDAVARAAPLFVAESLIELRAEIGMVRASSTDRCAAAIADTLENLAGEDDVVALGRILLRDLTGQSLVGADRRIAQAAQIGGKLRAFLEHAVDAFIETGTREAYTYAQQALEQAQEAVAALESIGLDPSGAAAAGSGRGAAAILVRELDVQLFETGLLKNLLQLGRRAEAAQKRVPGASGAFHVTSFLSQRRASELPPPMTIDEIEQRVAVWLRDGEGIPVLGEGPPPHVTLHQRQLRALLHLVDGGTEGDDDADRRARVHGLWTSTCRVLLARLGKEAESPLRRAITATVARGLDALLRDGAADPADVVLFAATGDVRAEDIAVLAEACMQPDASRLLRAYARFAAIEPGPDARAPLLPLDQLVAELPSGASQRTEGLRSVLSRLARALNLVGSAASLRLLVEPDATPLSTLEDTLDHLAQLTYSALRRCGGEEAAERHIASASPAYPLALAAGRAIQPGASVQAELRPSIVAVLERARDTLPRALVTIVSRILPRLASLPVDPPGSRISSPRVDEVRLDARLPAWLPNRRTLGGFYVHKQLGGGAAGTVFVVTRIEERHDAAAERFALKVPDYDATAARSISEADFLRLFREEAGALLALPEHPNLARFVTFDAGARPKPILVMELIEGTRCDQLIASGLLTLPRAFALLDGVLGGLEAMHSVGVGHLDIKPSNVILRGDHTPVLVDFGLAGRHIRPGCATTSYGAPEVWGITPEGVTPTPLTADIYSFGCFAFEVLTGETLFDAPNEVALISAHLTHDGLPPPLMRLRDDPRGAQVAAVLRHCLRKSARERSTAGELRAELRALAAELGEGTWPLTA
ncbi:MAG: serine/threonine-protein kinase [Byssovorax sp.]